MSDELTMNIGADRVALLDRETSIDRDVDLCEQLMAEPSRTHFRDVANARNVGGGVLNLG